MMRKKYHIIVVFCIAVLFIGCSSSPFASKAEGEAKKVGQDYWNKLITRCGEDYYSIDISPICGACPNNNTLTQLKDPEIITTSEDVNEAAKLNGFEKVGSTFVKIKAYRVFFKGEWLEWRQPLGIGGLSMRLTTSMFKKNGQWYFGDPKYQPHKVDWKPADCTQIPK